MEEDKKINTSSSNNNKRVRDHDELPEAKRIRDSLLDESEFLFLLDNNNINDSENQDLVSVMKSFKEEISLPLTIKEEEISLPPNKEVEIFSLTESEFSSEEISLPSNKEVEISSLTESELLIDFLLEASDDELGLPPNSSSSSSSSNEKEEGGGGGGVGETDNSGDDDDMLRVSSETTVVFDDHQIWGFEDDEISRSTTTTVQQLVEENFEGLLFDYCDVNDDDVLSLYGISDFSDFSGRSEWLPVL